MPKTVKKGGLKISDLFNPTAILPSLKAKPPSLLQLLTQPSSLTPLIKPQLIEPEITQEEKLIMLNKKAVYKEEHPNHLHDIMHLGKITNFIREHPELNSNFQSELVEMLFSGEITMNQYQYLISFTINKVQAPITIRKQIKRKRDIKDQ